VPGIVLLSGSIGSGKTELADRLEKRDGFSRCRTSKLLIARLQAKHGQTNERANLQAFSEALDTETNCNWVFDDALRALNDSTTDWLIVDAIRKPQQIAPFRDRFSWRITHIHLTAPNEVLRERFNSRRAQTMSLDQNASFDEATAHTVESFEADLRREADLVIDTSLCDADDVYVRAAGLLGLFPSPDERLVDVLIGGQFGSEGKGQIAAYLAKEYDVLLRVGGPNAGHRVSSESGVFTYHHLPSGCRDTNAKILIGAGAVLNPKKLITEIDSAKIDPRRIVIDHNAMTINDDDIIAEGELNADISSTAQGVGVASARKIKERGKGTVTLAGNHPEVKHLTGSVLDQLERTYARGGRIFLEGTQGAGLSLHHGFYPYVTSRDTNVAGCLAEAGISPNRIRRVVMVIRPYPIRVANPVDQSKTSGPLKREIDANIIAERAGLDAGKLRKAEVTSTTGRPRRFGEFDWTLLRRSCALNAPTDIAFTFADYIKIRNRQAFRFEQLTRDTIEFLEEIERVAQAPVSLINCRFDQRSVIDRRNWGIGRRFQMKANEA
jgi:adenylosuccinate synthase